jgi:hypothetical protein
MFASWRLERLERDFNLDCLVFGLMPCNFHKRRHRNDAKVKHSASLINKCLWTWEPSKKGSKNQTGYFKTDIIRYWCTVHTYTNYIYMCIHVYIIDYLCVCKSLSLCMSSFSSWAAAVSILWARREKPLPGHNEISLARQGADWDIFRDGSNRIQNQHTN